MCIFCLIHIPSVSRYELYQLEFETSKFLFMFSFLFNGPAESIIILFGFYGLELFLVDGPQIASDDGDISILQIDPIFGERQIFKSEPKAAILSPASYIIILFCYVSSPSNSITVVYENKTFSIPLSSCALSPPFLTEIISTSDNFHYCVIHFPSTVLIGVFVESLFVSLLNETAEFRSIEKVRYFGNQAVLVQLNTSAVILRNGRIESRFQGEQVFVDDFCNCGFPAYFCMENEKTTEYSLLLADHAVLVHSFLHIHSQKREKSRIEPQTSLQTPEGQSKMNETGRSLFFFGLRNRMQVLERELKKIRIQEDVLLALERREKQNVHWNRFVEGKTSIRSSTMEMSAISISVERIQSWKIGESIKIELDGVWKEANCKAFFWCYSLCQNCSIRSKRNQIGNGRFRAVFCVEGVKLISKDQSFYLFVNCDGMNSFVGEYRFALKPQDSSDYALIYNEYLESAKVVHYLKQIPGVRFSFVNSSMKCVHVPTDFETMLLLEKTIRRIDPRSTVLLDHLPLPKTRELIESICECLLNELRLIKEENCVLHCDTER